MDAVPEMDHDELIDELVDLIEHEPKSDGLFCVTKKEHIFSIIEKSKE